MNQSNSQVINIDENFRQHQETQYLNLIFAFILLGVAIWLVIYTPLPVMVSYGLAVLFSSLSMSWVTASFLSKNCNFNILKALIIYLKKTDQLEINMQNMTDHSIQLILERNTEMQHTINSYNENLTKINQEIKQVVDANSIYKQRMTESLLLSPTKNRLTPEIGSPALSPTKDHFISQCLMPLDESFQGSSVSKSFE